MASPAAKRRRLDLLSEGARRSPRLQEKAIGSPRRSGRLSPKNLFSSSDNQRRDSISSVSFYNDTRSSLSRDDSLNGQKPKDQRPTKGQKTKSKLWSSGPRLGGRGIPVGKMNKALKSQQRNNKPKKSPPGKKQAQKRSPQQKILQEVSLGKLSLSNNTSAGTESAGPKKFFKTRDRRPETVVFKTGFEIKFKCDAVNNEKITRKEKAIRKKRPLAVVGGITLSSNNRRKTAYLKETKENKFSCVLSDAVDNQNPDILNAAAEVNVGPRTPKTPGTREEEMLASWGFDCSYEVSVDTKMGARSTDISETERPSVLSAQDLLLTPLAEEEPLASEENGSVHEKDLENDDKQKLFPVFTQPAKRLLGRMSVTPTSSPGGDNKMRKLRGNKEKDGKEQYMLDAGQKLTGLIQCPTCGMNYNGDDQSDEDVHDRFHNNIIKTLSFQGWKCENVVREFNDGSRVVMVYADNKKQMLKVEKIRQIVDMELGFAQTNNSIKPNRKIFLYVSPNKEIAGYCLAEPIEKAYKLVTDSPRKNSRKSPRKKPLSCSNVPVPAKCGVNRIWVFHGYRHQGVATKLLDCVRFNFLVGCPLTLEELAYTDPTPDGRALFSKYNGHSQYLVYT